MKIIVFGAGAIGSLFGALLAKFNKVVLIGRKKHVEAIKKNGLTIEGKTKLHVEVFSEIDISKVEMKPDLIILTVKSYDTLEAVTQLSPLVKDDTLLLGMQNGLGNVDLIQNMIDIKCVIEGVTTNGAVFSKPGIITHTGSGKTIIGELDGKNTNRIKGIKKELTRSGIPTDISSNIFRDIWVKTIINSSINPLTVFCIQKNGYLLENPIIEKCVEQICIESTKIAKAYGFRFSNKSMIEKTKNVIKNTADNYSSMLQSINSDRKTEIDAINGKLAEIGNSYGIDTPLNNALIYFVKQINKK
ncbi:MAG: ketopantoate reductase family protein [Candidatus Thermoplasmatota archaeon]|nr:ketopantoate reductase family protein [Candidatus Thermoplasmatota archaeon]